MRVAGAAVADPALRVLLAKHAIRTIAPLSPEHVRVGKAAGRAAAAPLSNLRQRFPARAARAAAGRTPPDLTSLYVLELGARPAADVAQTVAALKADPAVLWAEEDRIATTSFVPNDPSYLSSGSWGQAYDDLHGLKRIGTTAAWDVTQGEGVVVAIVDTGIDYNHPDISANVWTNAAEIPDNGIDDDNNGFVDDVRGWDFVGTTLGQPTEDNDPYDGHFHGTHVAGTVAATGNNGVGVVGVAWKARVMAVKGLDDTGSGYDSDLARAIIYAVDNGADVINASFGGRGISQTQTEAVNYARAHGVVFVAAAGNSSADVTLFSPAGIPGTITVSSLSPTDQLSSFSNFGRKIDVAAPGEDILSLEHGTAGYKRLDGTSMAAPHVSGLAALIIAQHPEFSAEEVRQALRTSAHDLGSAGTDNSFGCGRIDALAALLVTHPLEAGIEAPSNGAIIAAPITLTGRATGSGFDHYIIDYRLETAPEPWTTIRTSSVTATGGELAVFNPSQLVDGLYTVRLRAFNTDGQIFTDSIQVRVRYLQFTWPATPRVPAVAEQVKPGATYPIAGSALGASFQSYKLDWAPGAKATTGWSTTGIALVGNGLASVNNGQLGQWTVPSAASGWYTLRLTVADNLLSRELTTSVYVEPALVSSGWPKFAGAVGYSESPVPVRQPDGSTRLVLCGAYTMELSPGSYRVELSSYAYDGSVEKVVLDGGGYYQVAAANLDGAPGDEIVVLDGWSLKIFSPRLELQKNVPTPNSMWAWSGQVVLEDLDNDGVPEIIFTAESDITRTNCLLLVYRADGTPFFANPPAFTAPISQPGRVVAVDLNGDGYKELVLGHNKADGTGYEVIAFNADGTTFAGWNSVSIPNMSVTSLAAADLAQDGSAEIVLCEAHTTTWDSQVRVLNYDGSLRPGWPITTDNASRGWPVRIAIGDLDRDHKNEIVAVTTASIQVLRADGSPWHQPWTVTEDTSSTAYNIGAPPVLADLDGDGFPEILVSSANVIYGDGPNYYRTKLRSFRRDGTPWQSWLMPGANNCQPLLCTPLAGDFNADGKTDIAVNVSLLEGGDIGGFFMQSALTCITPGTTFGAAASDWPGNLRDAWNSAALIATAPIITTQPQGRSATVGQSVTFRVAAGGSPVPSFQWLKDGAPIAGAASSTLSLAQVTGAMAGSYGVVVTNASGTVTSQAVTLTFTKAPATVTLSGLNSIFDGTPKTATATTNPSDKTVAITYNGASTPPTLPGNYDVVATINDPDYSGSTSGTLVITDNGPVVTNHSEPRQVLAPGDSTTLSVTAVATGVASYQWYHDGRAISDATTASLSLGNVTSANKGAYWVAITNAAGATRSAPFFVTVTPAATAIAAWGETGYTQGEVPPGLGRITAISAGSLHSLALKADGTVVFWGNNNNSPMPVPPELANVVAIEAANGFDAALKADGTVAVWGNNLSWGQANIPLGLKDVVAIAAGEYHVLALKTDGTVVAWGTDVSGARSVPSDLANVIAISAGDSASYALRSDGTVVAWGYDRYGQVGFTSTLQGIAAMDGGKNYALALKTDGQVQGAGYAGFNQVQPPAGLAGVIAISAGIYHSLALKSDGTVVAWGSHHIESSSPPENLRDVLAVSASRFGLFSLALRDARNDVAASITSQPADQHIITNHSGINPTAQFSVQVAGYPAPTCQWQLKKADGSTWYDVPNNGHYVGGRATTLQVLAPSPDSESGDRFRCVVTNYLRTEISNAATLSLHDPVRIQAISTSGPFAVPGHSASYSVEAFGTGTLTYQWTHNGRPIAGQTGSGLSLTQLTLADTGWYTVLVSDDYSTRRSSPIFLRVGPSPARIQAWGNGTDGQINVPEDIQSAVAIAAGANHAMALLRQGTIIGWGSNAGATIPAGLENVVAIECGSDFSVALKNDGTVTAWDIHGNPTSGIPNGLKNVVVVAAGNAHALALKSDGTVIGWGDNSTGQASPPVDLHDVVGIAAGSSYSLALKSDGTVVGWGSDSNGALTIPVGLNHVTAIASSNGHVLALREDGTVVGWGLNTDGEVIAPLNLTGVIAIAAGEGHSLAVKSDGTVVAWGRNNQGQGSVPQDLTDVFSAAAGANFSISLRAAQNDSLSGFVTQPRNQTVAPGGSAAFAIVAYTSGSRDYQWQRAPAGSNTFTTVIDGPGAGGLIFSGARTSQLSITKCVLEDNGDRFRCRISNGAGSIISNAATLAVRRIVTADFNGDDTPDLVLQNFVTGERNLRLMNGSALVAETPLNSLSNRWSIAAVADFNSDGQPDLLLQNLKSGERKVRLMTGSSNITDVDLETVPTDWSIAAAADFNGDGRPDILWQHAAGLRHVWFMNGTTRIGDTSLGSVPAEWSIAAAADFNGDGNTDIVWQHASGLRQVWFMDGTTIIGNASLGSVPPEWAIAMAADFNDDGKTDLLWQNTVTRQCFLWYLNGVTQIAYADLGVLPAGWSLAGVPVTTPPPANTHDFNGDGKPDLLLQHTSGLRHLWFMNGATRIGDVSLGSVPPEWSIVAADDFDEDSQTDILLQNLVTGERRIRFMSFSSTMRDVSLGNVPPEWSIAAVADFNGDGRPDLLWQHPSGLRHLWFMNGTTRVGDTSLGSVPPDWSIAAAADFNADGKPDIVWQHPSGLRYLWLMDGTTTIDYASLGNVPAEWSIAMVADFNSDGKTDILWQNATTGQRFLWFMDGPTPFVYADLGIVPVEWSIVK